MDAVQPLDRRGGRGLLLGCLVLLLLSSPAAARSNSAVVVAVNDGVITLQAIDAAWPDVIRELTRKTGMVVHVGLLPEGPITASYTGLDATQVMRRLFGPDAGFAFVYGPGPVPAEVWVASVSTPRSTVSASDVSATVSAPPELGHADAQVRADAADRLASEASEGGVEALARVVLTDPDAGVRTAAARGLVRIGTRRALDMARHAVFDEAKLVRLRTVEALADAGGEPARRILREAMRDEAAEVRDAAAAGIPDADVTSAAHRSDPGRQR